jgi:hypothetical protein
MADDAKPTKAATLALALPATVTLAADHAWFAKDGSFVHRMAGEIITAVEEIEFIIKAGVKLKD